MKKSLALVLALVMVLSSFSFVSAADYSDVEGTMYEEPVARLSKLEVLKGYPDGSFKPEGSITRAEFAAVAVRARGLAGVAEAAAGLPSGFVDVPATHWAAGYVGTAGSMGIVNGIGNGMFAPNALVKYEEAVTMLVRALGYEYDAQTKGGYPFGYLIVAEEIGLLDDARGTQGTFASRGLVAQLTDNALEIPMMIQSGTGLDARWIVSGEERTKEITLLEMMGYTPITGRVTDYDSGDMEIELNDKDDYEVPEGFDFYGAFGVEIKAWADGDEIVAYKLNEDVMFDAVEVTKTEIEIKLLTANKKYDVSEDVVVRVNEEAGDEDDLVKGDKHDYAKVVLNDDGDVIFVDAYDWEDFLVIEKVDGEDVVSYGFELDVEDYMLLKGGKEIAIADLEANDVLFYNDEVEVAEVFNKAVEGEIEEIFTAEFEVDGDEYEYALAEGRYETANVQYVDENEDMANFDDEAAEQMKDEGAVVLFFDRYGDVVYVTGDLGVAPKTTMGALLYSKMVAFKDYRDRETVEFDVVTEDGEAATYSVRLNSLDAISIDNAKVWVNADTTETVTLDAGNNNTYAEIKTPAYPSMGARTIVLGDVAAKGDLIEITVDEDGDVVEIGFFVQSGAIATAKRYVTASAGTYETGDKYFGAYKMSSSVPVFLVDDALTTWDDEDVEVTTFGEMEEEVSFLAYDIYNKDFDTTYVVAFETSMTKTSTYMGVITEVRSNDDGITRVKALVDGSEITYRVKDEINETWSAGVAANFIVEDATSLLRDINDVARKTTQKVDAETTIDAAMTKFITDKKQFDFDGTVYELSADGAWMYDVSDPDDIDVIKWTDLKDLKDGTNMTFIFEDQDGPFYNTTYVKYVLVGDVTPTVLVNAGADLTVAVDSTVTIATTTTPSTAAKSFVSSNTSVATVNNTTGVVTGVAPGTATITVTGTAVGYNNGTDTVAVTVTPVYTLTYDSPSAIDVEGLTDGTEYVLRIKTGTTVVQVLGDQGFEADAVDMEIELLPSIVSQMVDGLTYTVELYELDDVDFANRLAARNFVASGL
jgi:uncharacterized protein YjdB